jgi:hypothetical protein
LFALLLAIVSDGHLDTLKKIGFETNLWTLKPSKEDNDWMRRVIVAGKVSPQIIKEAYNIACTYNISITTDMGIQGDAQLIHRRLIISPLLCMANHSCQPNAALLLPASPEEIKHRVSGLVASRDIDEDEEILFSYLSNPLETGTDCLPDKMKKTLQPLKYCDANERRRIIKKDYGFLCECPRCNSELSSST